MAPAKPSLDLLRSLTDEHVLRALMAAAAADPCRARRSTGIFQADGVRERAPADRGRAAGGHRRTDHRARAGRLVLRARRGRRHAPWWSSIAPEGIVAELLDAHGDVISTAIAAVAPPGPTDAGRRGADGGGPDSAEGWLATAPARGGQRRRPGGPGHRPAGPPARRAVPGRRARPRRTCWPGSSTARSWSTTTSTGRPGPNATPPTADASTTSPTSTWARAWAAPSSATARYAADTPASPARSPTSSPSAPTAGPCPSPRCSPSSACAGRASTADRRRPSPPRRSTTRTLTRELIALAISGVIAALIALADPEVVVLGGSWGTHPLLGRAISTHLSGLPRSVAVRPATVHDQPALTGARHRAIHQLRDTIITRSHTNSSLRAAGG